MELSSNQKKIFHEQGYLIIDNFYTRQELEDFTNVYKKLIISSLKKTESFTTHELENFVGNEFNDGMMRLEEIDHSFVQDIYDTTPQIPEFLRLVAKSEISQCVNQLLNKPKFNPLYTFTCRCRIDPPFNQTRTTKWHQEVFYTIPESNFVQTWAPIFNDATKENGSILVCVGSHKENIALQSYDPIKDAANPFTIDEQLIKKYPKKVVEMKVGQLMIFNSRLFHKSGKNVSRKIRYSLIGMYHDIDNLKFKPAKINFKFQKSPEEFYHEIFATTKIN